MRKIKLIFIRTWLIVSILFQTSAFVFPALAEVSPKGIKKNQKTGAIIFERADYLFQSKDYDEALVQYEYYINAFPEGYFLDDAIFQMGEIYRLRKNYFMAIRYYELLQKSGIQTDLYKESVYKIAVCYLQSKYFKNAMNYFESNYSQVMDKKRKWEIIFLMGRTFEGMKDNISAFRKYLKSREAAPEIEHKQKSRQKISEMIEQKLSLEDLAHLAKTLPVDYPLDLVLWRLSDIYMSKRKYTLYQDSVIRFLNNFPNHEFYDKWKEKLETFLIKGSNSKTKIASILPLSGDAAVSGQKILQGIQLAFSLIPDDKRKDIELIVKDSKGNPDMIDEIMDDLGADNDVVCVLGPMFSRTAIRAIKKAETFQVPLLSPSASVKGLPDSSQYFFRNSLTQDIQGKAIAEYAVNNLNLNKYVLFHSSDLYATKLKDVFLDQINILGGEILAEKIYSNDKHDFKEQIISIGGMNDEELKKKALESILKEKNNLLLEDASIYEEKDEEMSTVLVEIIKHENKEKLISAEQQNDEDSDQKRLDNNKLTTGEAIKKLSKIEDMQELMEENKVINDLEEEINFNPFLKVHYDAIFIPGNPEKVGLIAPQLVFYNIDDVQLLGGNSWNSDNLIELGGKYVNGAIFVDGFFSNSYLSRVKEFNELYHDFFGEEPGILAAQAFDAANMVLDIVSKSRIDRQVMKNELLKIKNFKGVSGETTILPNGDSEKSVFFITIKKRRKVQIN